MEFLLLLWDELDDLTGACRHMATSAVDEVAGLTAPAFAAASAGGAWLLVAHLGSHAYLIAAALPMLIVL
jgi:hypothetical protein